MADFDLDVDMMLEMSFAALCLDFGNPKYENVVMYYKARIPVLGVDRLKPLCLFYVDNRKVEFIKRLVMYNPDILEAFCGLNYIHILYLKDIICLPKFVVFKAAICGKDIDISMYYEVGFYSKLDKTEAIACFIMNSDVEKHCMENEREYYQLLIFDLDYIKSKCRSASL